MTKAIVTAKNAERKNVNPAQRIVLLTKNNPKRPTGVSHERFNLYKADMTVGAYCEAVKAWGEKKFKGNAAKLRTQPKLGMADIIWDLQHGYIELHAASV